MNCGFFGIFNKEYPTNDVVLVACANGNFQDFLQSVNAEYYDMLCYTKVR